MILGLIIYGKKPIYKRKRKVKMSINCKEREVVDKTNLRPWSDLPVELVDIIASKLPLADRIRFPSVCKGWSFTCTPLSDAKCWPWLLYVPNDHKGSYNYNMFDPLDGKVYPIDDEVTAEHCLFLRFSKDGWVVLSDGNDTVLMMNPFTSKERVYLPRLGPDHYEKYKFYGISFSSPPTNSDCIVLGIRDGSTFAGTDVIISTWRYGEDAWSVNEFDSNITFIVAQNNPVFHEGRFYCLGMLGNLGVFDPKNKSWTILDKPKPPDPKNPRPDHYEADLGRFFRKKSKEQCYLVETSKGELLSIFVFNTGKPIRVTRLDKSKMSWEKVEDLGNEIIFVDARSSISIASPLQGYGNRIYFTRCLCEDGYPREGVYYDMKRNKYHTSSKYDAEERSSCAWVVPKLYRSKQLV